MTAECSECGHAIDPGEFGCSWCSPGPAPATWARLEALGFVLEAQLGGGCAAWFRYRADGGWLQVYDELLDPDLDGEVIVGTFLEDDEEPRTFVRYSSLAAALDALEQGVAL